MDQQQPNPLLRVRSIRIRLRSRQAPSPTPSPFQPPSIQPTDASTPARPSSYLPPTPQTSDGGYPIVPTSGAHPHLAGPRIVPIRVMGDHQFNRPLPSLICQHLTSLVGILHRYQRELTSQKFNGLHAGPLHHPTGTTPNSRPATGQDHHHAVDSHTSVGHPHTSDRHYTNEPHPDTKITGPHMSGQVHTPAHPCTNAARQHTIGPM